MPRPDTRDARAFSHIGIRIALLSDTFRHMRYTADIATLAFTAFADALDDISLQSAELSRRARAQFPVRIPRKRRRA